VTQRRRTGVCTKDSAHARRWLQAFRRWTWLIGLPALLGACAANGDFGRVKPEFVLDDTHAWLGPEAVSRYGGPFSVFPLTDDERTLRDLAFALIEPAYDRQRWYEIVSEYGVRRFFQRDWLTYVPDAYERQLMGSEFRSANARYAKLNDDIRNDVLRIPPFFVVARRVVDMDDKRAKSLAHVGTVSPRDQRNAIARNAENALVIAWVQCSLSERAGSYRYALEHLVVATPAPNAVDVERSLTLLQNTIVNTHLLDEPNICVAPMAPLSLAPVAPGPVLSGPVLSGPVGPSPAGPSPVAPSPVAVVPEAPPPQAAMPEPPVARVVVSK
jgi:hypothetical protein